MEDSTEPQPQNMKSMREAPRVFGELAFDEEQQRLFAQLSGDYNPIHIDPAIARRLLYGEVVVHGIHTALKTLDTFLAMRGFESALTLTSVAVRFSAPVRLSQPLTCHVDDAGECSATLVVRDQQTETMSIAVSWIPGTRSAEKPVLEAAPPQRPPLDLTAETLPTAKGATSLYCDHELAARLFPTITKLLHPTTIALFLASTRIVGMKCPGEHSLYSELHLRSSDEHAIEDSISYEVRAFDERFNLATIALSGAGFDGQIRAFLRYPPQDQPTTEAVHRVVTPGEFANHRAVVVGGSRGLGETAAKILAVGGAEVLLTYKSGERDADRVVAEIREGGGTASATQYDVIEATDEDIEELLRWAPTSLLYFATPRISAGSATQFSEDLFGRMTAIYVTAFARLVNQLLGKRTLNFVFYPSSVFLDEHPKGMAEYVSSKGAAEAFCRYLAHRHGHLRVVVPRLPRLRTDQTVGLLAERTQDVLPVLIDILRSDDQIGDKNVEH